MANVRDPAGLLFSAAAVIPRPSDEALAASWDVVAAWCDPPPPVVRYLGPGGYSSLTDPPTLAPLAPALASDGSFLSRSPLPSVSELRAEAEGAAAPFVLAARRGYCTSALVYDAPSASELRFVLRGDPSGVLASLTLEVSAYNIDTPIPSGYLRPSPPSDVRFAREPGTSVDVPVARVMSVFHGAMFRRFGLTGADRVRAPVYDAGAGVWRDDHALFATVAPDSEALPLGGAAPGDRVLFAVTRNTTSPGAWWRCGVVE